MKRLLLTIILLPLAVAASAQTDLPHPPGKRIQVRAQGCVEAGVEANCLLARDLRSGKLYNLLFKGIAPQAGLGIEFTGEQHEGPSTCMQGTAVDVTTWTRKDTLKCPRAPQRRK